MAVDSFDDKCEFWLPPKFLCDDEDDVVFTEKFNNKAAQAGFGFDTESHRSYGGSSDFGSPVESVTETESDEEDYLAELTRQMAQSTLQYSYETANKAAGGYVSGSPQSTLCPLAGGCGCRGSSHESPNGHRQALSQPTTWDLLYAAASEVARMRANNNAEERFPFTYQNRGGLMAPQRRPTVDFEAYYKQMKAVQLERLRQQQMMKQKGTGVWIGQAKQNPQMVQNRGGRFAGSNRDVNVNANPLGLSPSAWPPLHHALPEQPSQEPNRAGLRAVFLGNPAGKRESVGTGVFLPRRANTPTETRKKQAGCPTVLIPAKVVQALNLNLNLNLDEIGGQPHFQGRNNAAVHHLDSDGGRGYWVPPQKFSSRRRQQPAVSQEIRLPQEWTY